MRKIFAGFRFEHSYFCQKFSHMGRAASYLFGLSLFGSSLTLAAPPAITAFDFSNINSNTDPLHMGSDVANLKTVAVGWYSVDGSGTLSGGTNPTIKSIAATNNIPLLATIPNAGFNTQVGHDMLTTYRTSVISQIVNLATTQGFAGIDLDIEGIAAGDRQNYTDFVGQLALALHNNGKKLTLSVPAKLFDDLSSNWSGAFDYAALSNLADTLQIMAYDQHGASGSDPGPVAGLDWVIKCLDYTLKVASVPASKVNLGIPTYGYDWNIAMHTVTPLIGWDDIPAWLTQTGAISQWSSTTSSPFADYTDANGHTHKVWYENRSSIRAKAALAASLGLSSVSIFSLEKDNASLWPAVIAGINQTAVSIGSVNYLLIK